MPEFPDVERSRARASRDVGSGAAPFSPAQAETQAGTARSEMTRAETAHSGQTTPVVPRNGAGSPNAVSPPPHPPAASDFASASAQGSRSAPDSDTRDGWVSVADQIPIAADTTFYQRRGKRILDATLAGLAILALLPLFLVLFIAIKLEDGGPIFYTSIRVGKAGRLFKFYKFRSMVTGADAVRADLEHMNEVDGPVFKCASDPRITRVGRFLRRTSMDELPQFWNVFVGDMSLVGPRPPLPAEVVQYEPWQLRRLSVVPGLTCLWQISGRSTIGFDEWMRLDNRYIDTRSFRTDLGILLRTIPAVLSGEGAY